MLRPAKDSCRARKTGHGRSRRVTRCSQSPAVPAAASGAFADADEEADPPDHEDSERDPPQNVDSEPEAAEDQGQQENEQNDCHDVFFLPVTDAVHAGCVPVSSRLPRARPLIPPNHATDPGVYLRVAGKYT